jgi:PPOX class probable F420-dependent enzyme
VISENSEFDTFVSQHRWAVLTTLRSEGTASSSVVAYARQGDHLLVSTPGFTFKRKTIEKDPRVTLCIISNQEPFNFVSIEGNAQIETTEIEDATKAVFANIASVGYALPEDLPGWLKSQQRVILRINPGKVSGVIR